MTKIKIILGFLFIFLSIGNQLFATHIAGGNISYSCTGNPNEYLVSLTLYRDCSGVSAPSSASISFSNGCGLSNPSLPLTLTAILPGETAEVSQLCPTSLGQSTCNGGSLPGIEQYVYTGIVVLPDCNSWSMSYNICDRNPTTNLSGTNCMNLVSTIDSSVPNCNSSPSIVTNYPIPYVCNGQPVSHDFGVIESDGNTLQFSFVNALGSGSSNLTYNAGYSAAVPIPGITIDPNTGQVNFTPTLNGAFVVTVLITELDAGGNVIGTMMHDIQFVVQNCVNNGIVTPAGTSNFNNNGSNATLTATNVIQMCDGDEFCVDVVFSDPDAGDILFLGTNALDILPGAIFTQTGTNPATGTLCWTYTDGYTGNLISITASDSVCPTPSNVSYIINLDIPPPLNASPDVTICGDQLANLQAFGTAPVTWQVIPGTPNPGEPIMIGTNFTCNPCTTPIATPSITTMYEVTEGSSCQLVDTILVTVVQNQGGITSTILTSDTTLCPGECFNVNALAEEEFSGTSAVYFASNSVFAINSNATVTSNLNVSGLNMTNLSVGSIQSVCIDIDHTYDGDLDIFLLCPDGTQFELTTDNGGGGDDFQNTCFTIDAVTQINSGSAPFTGNFVPEGGVLSGALIGCSANGTWSLQVTDDAGGDTGTLYSWNITLNDDIPSNGPATSLTWGNTAGMTDPTSATTEICPTVAGEYILYTYNVDNCWASDTFNISMATFGLAGLDSTINICKESPQIDLFTYLGGTPDVGGQWKNTNGDNITAFILPDTITTGDVFEYEIGGASCATSAFITVNIIELSSTTIIDNSDCQASNGFITVNITGNLGPINYSIDNGVTTQISNTFNNLAGASPIGIDYTILSVDSIGCQITNTETILDDNFPQIDNIITINSDCGLDNGEVSVTTASSGGTAPYNYIVENITLTGYQNLPITNLAPSVPTTFNLIVEDAFGCHDTLAFTIDEINLPLITTTPTIDNICNGGTAGEITVNGNNLNYYSIDGGTNVQSNNTFTGLAAGSYTITAYSSDPATSNACSDVKNTVNISEPQALAVTIDIPANTTICPNDEITLIANEQGGLGNTTLTWTTGGTVLNTGNSSTQSPTINTQYCVTITEGNCPIASSCIDITMPTPIIPNMTSDVVSGCYPLTVDFTNTSTNGAEIATTEWFFTPSITSSVIGNSNVISTYDDAGVYDIEMIVTSIYGCVYSTTFNQYIEAFDYPQANFTYTPIPPNIYDTEINLVDLSSDDVITWNWSITGGSPSSSSQQNLNAVFPEGVPGIYPVVLTVTNDHGCSDSLVSQVEVINDVICYAPNVFTPDGDEFNETWRVYISGIDVYDYHLTIFNRWGEIIWESYNPEGEWDGTYAGSDKVLDDTFVWVLNAKDSYTDKKYEFRGTVTSLK